MLEFAYKPVIEFCLDRVLKAEKIALLEQWRPKSLPKGYRKFKVPELNPLFLDALTERRAKKLFLEDEARFGFTARDACQFFGWEIKRSQLVRLSQKGKLKVVGIYYSRTSSFEADMYSPVELAQLTEEDRAISDAPLWMTQSELMRTGWTKTLIARYLPEPRLEDNPKYKSGAPMKLWETDLVQEIEARPEFQAAKAKSARHGNGAAKAVQTKKRKLMEQIQEQIKHIHVQSSLKGEALINAAIESRQEWYDCIALERGNWNNYYRASDADELTIRRWVVNYIRHELTDYDEDLYEMAGKVGCHEGYAVYRDAVLDKIAEVYPDYADECRRQKDSNWGYYR